MKKSFLYIPYYIGLLCLFFLLLNFKVVKAQHNDTDTQSNLSFKERFFYGGSFGLQFGRSSLVDISPIVGFKLTPRLGIGVGASYKYYRIKDYFAINEHLKINVAGGSLFARYFLFDDIFVHVEYEKLIYKSSIGNSGYNVQSYTSYLAGGGYRQWFSEKISMNMLLLWNLNDTPDSPYTNPIIRMGFSIGM